MEHAKHMIHIYTRPPISDSRTHENTHNQFTERTSSCSTDSPGGAYQDTTTHTHKRHTHERAQQVTHNAQHLIPHMTTYVVLQHRLPGGHEAGHQLLVADGGNNQDRVVHGPQQALDAVLNLSRGV